MAAAPLSSTSAYGISNIAPGLSRKIKKLLSIKLNTATVDAGGEAVSGSSGELYAAFVALSEFYEVDKNDVEHRRGLKSLIEQRAALANKQYLDASEGLQEYLDLVGENISKLEETCEQMTESLSGCRSSTDAFIEEHGRLAKQLEVSEKHSQIVGEFLRDYQLTPKEMSALKATEGVQDNGNGKGGEGCNQSLGDEFFDALERVQSIHKNCRHLLRTHHQRAGLELMNHMSGYQEAAYERLCRWVQTEFRFLGDVDSPEVSADLRRGSEVLRTRPVLFNYCLEELAIARHNALFRRFIGALTRGGPKGVPRPIEIHAHDPKRYIGDMLAWIHQALANEKEFVGQIIVDRMQGSAEEGGKERKEENGDSLELRMSTSMLLDRIFEGVCRPFRVRVEQVLSSSPGASLTFRLASLLSFMMSTMLPFVGTESVLIRTIQECADSAKNAFQDRVRGTGEKLIKQPPTAQVDLAPPHQLSDGLQQMDELLDSEKESILISDGDAEFVLDAFLDPMIQFCQRSADMLEGNSSGALEVDNKQNAKVYLVNCFLTILATTKKHKSAAKKTDEVEGMVENCIRDLVEDESQKIMVSCRVADVIEMIRAYEDSSNSITLSEDPALDLQTLCQCLQRIFEFAATSNLPEFNFLQQPRLRSISKDRIANAVLSYYEIIYNAIMDPNNGYADPGHSLQHNPDFLKTVLGI